jgi:hypothetical protein
MRVPHVLLAAVVGIMVLQISHSEVDIKWKDCGETSYSIHVMNVTWMPNPIQLGVNTTIISSQVVQQSLSGITNSLVISSFPPKNWNGCMPFELIAPFDLAKVFIPADKCPLLPGMTSNLLFVWLSPHIPRGSTEIRLTSVTSDTQKPVMCLSLNVNYQ